MAPPAHDGRHPMQHYHAVMCAPGVLQVCTCACAPPFPRSRLCCPMTCMHELKVLTCVSAGRWPAGEVDKLTCGIAREHRVQPNGASTAYARGHRRMLHATPCRPPKPAAGPAAGHATSHCRTWPCKPSPAMQFTRHCGCGAATMGARRNRTRERLRAPPERPASPRCLAAAMLADTARHAARLDPAERHGSFRCHPPQLLPAP